MSLNITVSMLIINTVLRKTRGNSANFWEKQKYKHSLRAIFVLLIEVFSVSGLFMVIPLFLQGNQVFHWLKPIGHNKLIGSSGGKNWCVFLVFLNHITLSIGPIQVIKLRVNTTY